MSYKWFEAANGLTLLGKRALGLKPLDFSLTLLHLLYDAIKQGGCPRSSPGPFPALCYYGAFAKNPLNFHLHSKPGVVVKQAQLARPCPKPQLQVLDLWTNGPATEGARMPVSHSLPISLTSRLASCQHL